MRKFVSIGGRQVTIVITVAILATLAALYYFVYIPNKENDLYQEHFSWLQRSDKNIRDKISATDSLLSHILQIVNKTDTGGNEEKTTTAKKIDYIRKYLLGPQQSIDTSKARDTTKTDQDKIHFFIEADSSLGRFIITASMKQGADSIVASMWYDFDQFFKPVLDQGSFEYHVVFFKGRYIYEDFHSGLGYWNEDSLLRIGPWMTGAAVIDQRVGGVPYKMFLQPISLFGRDRLIVAGLHSKKKFDAEKKQLPADKMMLAIILALGILLFFPWIRIYFLGKYDRLTLGDAVESLLVGKFLIAVVFLFFFKYSFTSRSPDSHSLKVLSDTIRGAFHNEIDSAYKYLGKFDNSMPCDSLNRDIISLGSDSISKNISGRSFDPKYIRLDSVERKKVNDIYKQFGVIEINWMDTNGTIKYNWTSSDRNSASGNYKDRDYFKDISKGKVISPGSDTSVAFTLQPVISWTNGEFSTVICRKSTVKKGCSKRSSPSFVLMDWTMKSMDDVILPAGYSFAIIDANGEVQYHSDEKKNLNENLLSEFSKKKELQEVLHGGYTEEFNTNYYEENYSVRAEPIKDYPYFIVVMSSSRFPNGVDVETFAFSWGMMLIFLIVVLTDLFIFVVSSGRRSMFRKQSLVTSWLWPRESSQSEYIIAGVGHVIVIIALVISLPSFSYLSRIFALLFCVPLLTIFLNALFIHKYRLSGSKWYERYKDRCSWYCISFLLLVNIIALLLLQRHYLSILLFELALVAIGTLLFYFYQGMIGDKKTVDSKSEKETKKYSYLHWFTFMALTRLIITSAIPIVFFYTSSYNFEQNLLARNRQYDYASKLRNKFPEKSSIRAAIGPDVHNTNNAVYTDGEWIDSLAIAHKLPRTAKLSLEDTNAAGLFNSFGSYFEYISGLDNDNFYLSSPPDGAYTFNDFFDKVLYNDGYNQLYVPLKDNEWMQLNTAKLNYTFPPLFDTDGSMFWLLLLMALLAFYIMLYDVIKRVCSIDTRKVATWEVAGEYCRKLINSKFSFWMVYACPGDLKDFLLKNVGAAKPAQNFVGPPRIIDFDDMELSTWNYMITQILSSDNANVCILHIESRLNDEGLNAAKLGCIRSLLAKGKRIIIVSALHPIYFRDMLRSKTTVNIAESFDHAIGDLPVIIKPLVKYGYPPTEEYSHSDFLWNLHNKLSFASEKATQKAKKELAYDELVLQEQSVSHNFYTEIWESLSTDEKFILYDLAEDGLVNIKNRFAVNLLVNKGLIHNDNGHLRLFNRSFRHFIVSATSKESMRSVETLRKKRSSWSNLKKPMLTIVIAIFIFFGISQESMYKNFVAVLGVITAGIPILLKLLSMFDIQSDRQGKNGEEKSDAEVA